MILSLATTLFMLCPVSVVPHDTGLFDLEIEHWILELPRKEVRHNLDTGCVLLKGRYT